MHESPRQQYNTDLLVVLEKGFERSVVYEDDHPIEITFTTPEGIVKYWNKNMDEWAGLWSIAKILYSKDGTAIQQ